jgi:serine/threonine-protein kinase SRPK3
MAALSSFMRRYMSLRLPTTTHVRSVEDSLPPQAQETKPADPDPASNSRDASPVRVFPTSGFPFVNSSVKLEEEAFSWYSPKKFYSARIGEVLHDKYQVITKLGHGTASTTWLCRDLQ